MDICGRKPFFGLLYDFKFALKMAIFQTLWYARKDASSHKSSWDHFIIDTLSILLIKSGFRFAQIPSESAFYTFFSKDPFSIKFPIIAVWALRQGEGVVKNGFERVFLGPHDIPHTFKYQA